MRFRLKPLPQTGSCTQEVRRQDMANANSNSNTSPAANVDAYIDPATLMRIKNLQLRAKVVVEGFYNGLHRSPFHGFSVEFSEYRQYSPGDDTRYLDWRLFARTDRYFIKQFEDETNRRCYVILDMSRSMNYGSLSYSKMEYARTLAGTLAYYFTLQKDNVGLFSFDQAVKDFVPARHRPGHLQRIMACLAKETSGSGTDLISPLDQVASLVKKRGLVILISDLLASLESLQQSLSYLRARGHELLILRTLDPAELDFPFENASLFRDIESQSEIYVDPEVAKAEYQQRFQEHQRQVQDICHRLGIDYTVMRTDEPLERALFDLLNTQMRMGRQVTHRANLNSGGGNSGRNG